MVERFEGSGVLVTQAKVSSNTCFQLLKVKVHYNHEFTLHFVHLVFGLQSYMTMLSNFDLFCNNTWSCFANLVENLSAFVY